MVVATLVLGVTWARASGPEAVGHGLSLRPSGPTMQPVQTPARVQLVASVPSSPDGETWAVGLTSSPIPGGDRLSAAGQTVFLQHRGRGGWTVVGAPVDETGAPVNPSISSVALAVNGEGWAGSANGELFHRRPGGPWVRDDAASLQTRGSGITSISLNADEDGVYGYAVGGGMMFLRLTDGAWARDTTTVSVPAGAAVPDLASVNTASRSDAWAVTGPSTNTLMIFHREGGVWVRVTTGRPMFDAPPSPVLSGGSPTVNSYARGSAIAVAAGQVWVTGTMSVVDAVSPLGGDRSRPFALRLHASSRAVRSWCPRTYQFNNQGVATTTTVCDSPFPYATAEDLPALAAFGDGRVLAAGSGFFEFDGNEWQRRPSVAGYAVSATFASPDEGWLAADGVSTAGGGRATESTNTTLAHWTTTPEPTLARRWAQPLTSVLESVAVHPSGGPALAVGEDGAIARLEPGVGWDAMGSPASAALHAVAWPEADRAWAVGAAGTILRFDGRTWSPDPASGGLTKSSLLGLAFASPNDGVAVGDEGTILRWDGRSWTRDTRGGEVPKQRLTGVAVSGGSYLVVGHAATALASTSGAPWRPALAPDITRRLRSGQSQDLPNLLSVAVAQDGTVLLGGSRGVLLQRDPGGEVRTSDLGWIDGSIHSMVAWRQDGRLRAVVSAGRSDKRHNGDQLAEPYGWLLASDGDGWRDLVHGRVRERSPDLDAPVLRDAVYGLAMDPGSPGRAWAVGGFPRNVRDEDGHVRFTSTSSIWRVALERTPPEASPAESVARLPESRAGAVQFAFFGDTTCVGAVCASTLGSGNRGDVVMTRALRSIDRLGESGQAAFAVFGGDARRNGIPDELNAVKGMFDELSIPFFAAIGDRDQFSSLSAGGQSLLRSNGYYLETFADRVGPWGHKPAPKGFFPVALPGDSAPAPGRARTHYAVDHRTPSGTRVRLVVLDTSQGISRVDGQNPAEDQLSWLQRVLADARIRDLPTVVVMHQPQVLPVDTSVDSSLLTGTLTAGGVTVALASHQRLNRLFRIPSEYTPGAVPIGIFGGGGSALEAGGVPEMGAYHSWQLVSIEPQAGSPPAVRIRSVPVLESVALSAPQGRTANAGSALRFGAVGRAPDLGGSHSDGTDPNPDQGRSTYLRLPFPAPCELLQQPISGCRPPEVVVPDYRFVTGDPSVALFVREDPSRPGLPFRDTAGRLVADPQSGLLCTFRAGETVARVEVGEVASEVPVQVRAGSGVCNPGILAPASDPALVVEPPAEPRGPVEPGRGENPPAHLLQPRSPESALALLATPPVPSPAPSPPGGGSGEKEEERELATDQAEMSRVGDRDREAFGLLPAGVAMAVGLGLAGIVGLVRRRAAPATTTTIWRNS